VDVIIAQGIEAGGYVAGPLLKSFVKRSTELGA
jgi:hypothetical protein